VQVIVRPIRTANELWMPEFRTIVIRSVLRAAHQRVALAHGIGHADLGHEDDRPKHETQANQFAALYLIDPLEFRDVAKWAQNDKGLICTELGITTRVLDAYLRPA
jgi:Zn-dependent peptidase ImmA (M78 family)